MFWYDLSFYLKLYLTLNMPDCRDSVFAGAAINLWLSYQFHGTVRFIFPWHQSTPGIILRTCTFLPVACLRVGDTHGKDMDTATDMTITGSLRAMTVNTRARTEENGESSSGPTIRPSTRPLCLGMPELISSVAAGGNLLHHAVPSLDHRRVW